MSRRLPAAAAVLPVAVTAGPGLALSAARGDGSSIGGAALVAIYVFVPLAAILLIAAAVYAPVLLRRPRYRPTRPWAYEPMWFAAPEDPEAAYERARAGAVAQGGSSGSW